MSFTLYMDPAIVRDQLMTSSDSDSVILRDLQKRGIQSPRNITACYISEEVWQGQNAHEINTVFVESFFLGGLHVIFETSSIDLGGTALTEHSRK